MAAGWRALERARNLRRGPGAGFHVVPFQPRSGARRPTRVLADPVRVVTLGRRSATIRCAITSRITLGRRNLARKGEPKAIPPVSDAPLARWEALAGSRRRGASGAHDGEVIASGRSPPAPAAERLREQSARELREPGWPESTGQARPAGSFGSAQGRGPHRRP